MNSNELIEANFLIPLEAHYGVKCKPGVRLTIINELAGATETTLINAAGFIKRTRKAMSFPSPAECIAATRASRTPTAAGVGDITGANYAQKAAEYAKASSRETFPVITKWEDQERGKFTPQWEAWQSYWEHLNARSTLALIRERASWTVPTDWPYQFDANARWTVGDPVGARDAA